MSSRVVMLSIVGALVGACVSARQSSNKGPMTAAIVSSAASQERVSLTEQWRLQFEERRALGRGIFITEEEIRDAKAPTLGVLLRHVPGVRFACRPAFIVDGARADYSTDLDLPTVGILGIEMYRTAAETPLEFLGGVNACSTIVIWTGSSR